MCGVTVAATDGAGVVLVGRLVTGRLPAAERTNGVVVEFSGFSLLCRLLPFLRSVGRLPVGVSIEDGIAIIS